MNIQSTAPDHRFYYLGRIIAVLELGARSHGEIRSLARAIADAGMAGFLDKLQYKCARYGADYLKADRWYASSKPCSHCRWKNHHLTLSETVWRCDWCGALNQRDANAARNLELWPGLSFPVTGRGDRVRSA